MFQVPFEDQELCAILWRAISPMLQPHAINYIEVCAQLDGQSRVALMARILNYACKVIPEHDIMCQQLEDEPPFPSMSDKDVDAKNNCRAMTLDEEL